MKSSDIEKFNEKVKRRGIVYISSVPKHMKPEKVKALLSRYGTVNRIYLVKEDATKRKKRVHSGGNRKANYTEGWIEFEDKKIAKRVARLLNATIIGGKKTHHYHDDMWNLKYLKSFQWSHLTEKVAYESRVRDQRMKLELSQAKKENALFMERVEISKKIDKKRALTSSSSFPPASSAKKDNCTKAAAIHRVFKQTDAATKKESSDAFVQLLAES